MLHYVWTAAGGTAIGNASRWKEGLVARAKATAESKVDLMRLVYGEQEMLVGSSLQHHDSDESDDEDLFRLRNNMQKVFGKLYNHEKVQSLWVMYI